MIGTGAGESKLDEPILPDSFLALTYRHDPSQDVVMEVCYSWHPIN